MATATALGRPAVHRHDVANETISHEVSDIPSHYIGRHREFGGVCKVIDIPHKILSLDVQGSELRRLRPRLHEGDGTESRGENAVPFARCDLHGRNVPFSAQRRLAAGAGFESSNEGRKTNGVTLGIRFLCCSFLLRRA